MGRKKNIIELTHCSAEEYRNLKKNPFIIITDNVRSMHNVGSVFRTADAFKAEEIILGGISGTPPHPEITKTALGAEKSVKWRHVKNTIEEVERLKRSGWKICVLEQAHDSIPLNEFKVNKEDKIVLVIGNEISGVDQQIVDKGDYILEIPQYGIKHSLNVSVSAGIAIYSISSQFSLLKKN